MPPQPDRKGRKPKKGRNHKDGQGAPTAQSENANMGGQSHVHGEHLANQRTGSSSTVTTFAPSQFAGANNFSIQNQTITTTHIGSSKTLFYYLGPHIIHGAAHDSHDQRDAPACHEETRVAIRENIVTWMKHIDDLGRGKDKPKKIMWLSGPAGAGKSAIAGSVAETCKREGILAASFFFSSFSPSVDRRYNRGFVASLVHFMAQSLDQFGAQLLLALERRPDIFHKTLKEQAETLILAPFSKIHGQVDRKGWPAAVIVDGVDEVTAPQGGDDMTQQAQSRTSEDDQIEVLEVLLALGQSPYFPFRIFVASRPEKNITDFFSEPAAQSCVIPLFLDAKYEPDADIERFLESKFAQIRRRARIANAAWPGKNAIQRIVEMSSGQFIVPTTAIRWIESGLPHQRLDEILKLHQDNNPGSKNPFESLDALYRHILARGNNPDGDGRLIVKWILAMTDPNTFAAERQYSSTAVFWRQLFEDVEGELDYRMAPISSLIFVPPPDDARSPVTMYHKSLVDYLSAERRCGPGGQCVSGEEVDAFLAHRIVEVLKNRGPKVRLSPPAKLKSFLARFANVRLVLHSDARVQTRVVHHAATFLSYMDAEATDVLTSVSCDTVAWWVKESSGSEFLHGRLLAMLHGVYFGVHRALNCEESLEGNRDVGLPVQRAPSNEQSEGGQGGCHQACRLWRGEITAKVKALGWCTHRLERTLLHELQYVSVWEAEGILGAYNRQKCWICPPERKVNRDWCDRCNGVR